MIGNKPKKTLDDITRDLCPVLSIQQLYRISTMYWDDKYNTETVSSDVSSSSRPLAYGSSTLLTAGSVLGHKLGNMLKVCVMHLFFMLTGVKLQPLTNAYDVNGEAYSLFGVLFCCWPAGAWPHEAGHG